MTNATIAYVKGAKISKSMPLATMRHNTGHLLMDLQLLPLTFIQNSNSSTLIKAVYQLFSRLCTIFNLMSLTL